MNQQHAEKIETSLSADAVVIDVGGGAAPFRRADWVIDALAYEQRNCLRKNQDDGGPLRFSRDTWVQLDICHHEPWPFEDKQFDYAICSHVLEDVRDPIWVCREMSRIASAGYIEVPSRIVEQSMGIEHPQLAGYHHHRWLVSICDNVLEFRFKPHLLHTIPEAIVSKTGFWRKINSRYEIESYYWNDNIECREILTFREQDVIHELSQWARQARELPDLLVRRDEPLGKRWRRAYYFLRLARRGA